MDPIDFMSDAELREYVRELRTRVWKAEAAAPKGTSREAMLEYIREENGSARRFHDVFRKRPGWWVIHNILAHGLIGVAPIKPFFEFHDYTARRLRGGR